MSDSGSKLSFSALDSKTEYYAEWEFRMTTLLRAKGCFYVIEEDAPMSDQNDPASLSNWTKYQTDDRKAMGVMVKYLSAYAINIVKNSKSAKEMWCGLKSAYENRSAANQLHLLNRLLRLKMKPDDQIETHYTRLDNLIAELRLAGVDISDEQLLSAILLLSMPITYAPAVTALTMSAKEDLLYETVKLKLKNHNLHLTDMVDQPSTSTSTSTVMFMNETGNPNHQKMGNENGFRQNGFRHGQNRSRGRGKRFQNNGRGNRNSFGHRGRGNPNFTRNFKRGSGARQFGQQSDLFCTFCKGTNHNYKSCRELKRLRNGNSNTYQNDQQSNGTTAQANLIYCQEKSSDFGFIGMLSSRLPNLSSPVCQLSRIKKMVPFYNDTGANRFVTIDETLLTNPEVLNPPINIRIFRRNVIIQATKVGDIHIITDRGYKILLKNVYYTPDGTCNILSIPLLQFASIQYKLSLIHISEPTRPY